MRLHYNAEEDEGKEIRLGESERAREREKGQDKSSQRLLQRAKLRGKCRRTPERSGAEIEIEAVER